MTKAVSNRDDYCIKALLLWCEHGHFLLNFASYGLYWLLYNTIRVNYLKKVFIVVVQNIPVQETTNTVLCILVYWTQCLEMLIQNAQKVLSNFCSTIWKWKKCLCLFYGQFVLEIFFFSLSLSLSFVCFCACLVCLCVTVSLYLSLSLSLLLVVDV